MTKESGVGRVGYMPPPCIVCGKTGQVLLRWDQYQAWQNGALIQDAFPDLSADEREQIKSGIHPACWDSMFGDEEED